MEALVFFVILGFFGWIFLTYFEKKFNEITAQLEDIKERVRNHS